MFWRRAKRRNLTLPRELTPSRGRCRFFGYFRLKPSGGLLITRIVALDRVSIGVITLEPSDNQRNVLIRNIYSHSGVHVTSALFRQRRFCPPLFSSALRSDSVSRAWMSSSSIAFAPYESAASAARTFVECRVAAPTITLEQSGCGSTCALLQSRRRLSKDLAHLQLPSALWIRSRVILQAPVYRQTAHLSLRRNTQ